MNTYKHLLVIVLLFIIVPTLEAAPTLTFEYGADDKPIRGVRVTQTESDGTITIYASNAAGEVVLTTTTNTYTLAASLAETGTDPISVQDALYILQHIVELRTLNTNQIKAADINGDGNLTIQDALKVLQHNVELITLEPSLSFYDKNTGNTLSTITFSPGDTPLITAIRQGDANLSFEPGSITDHAPILTGPTTLNVNENTINVTTLLGVDADDDTLTYTLSGTDESYFTISSSGVLTFKTAPDYETKSSYSVTVTVNDGVNEITKTLTINVIDVNENLLPYITNMPESISIVENSSIVYDFDALDPEGDTIYFITSGIDSSLFEISSSGALSFKNAPDYENPEDSDKDNKYEVEVSVTDINPESSNYSARFDLVAADPSYDSSVRVSNFDEDIISLTMTGEDGTSSSPPKIIISLVIDSYTNPTSVAILYENLASSSQYWTTAGAPIEDNFQMTYEYSFTAPENAPTGEWRIRTIRVNTADGYIDHQQTYLNNKGFTTTATLYNPSSDTNKPTLNSISSVEVTGNDLNPDTNIVIKFEITAADTENGYQKAHSRWESPASEGGWALVGGWGNTDLSSDPPKTIFTASLDPKTVSGLYKMEDIRLYDKAGNQHFYKCLEREGEYRLLSEDDTTIDGTNYGLCTVNIDNPIQDNTKPVLTNFSITALVDESNGRKKIAHSIEIDNKTSWTDQETGLRRMYLRIYGPNGFMRDIHDGDLGFSGETLLPLDADAGEYYVSYFFVTDLALNDNKYYKAELDDLGFTTSITFD